MDWKKAAEQLNDSLKSAEEELQRKPAPNSSDGVVEMLSATIRLEDAIRRVAPHPSIYIRQLNDGQDQSIVARCQFAVAKGRALLADVTSGSLIRVAEIVRSEQFSSYLEMAEHLLAEGYKDAAAVIAGSSLEVHLKNLATKASLPIASTDGQPFKASRLNDDLARGQVYDKNAQKLITGWLGIRNDAAHGDYDKVKKQDVELMAKWIRTFVFDYPA